MKNAYYGSYEFWICLLFLLIALLSVIPALAVFPWGQKAYALAALAALVASFLGLARRRSETFASDPPWPPLVALFLIGTAVLAFVFREALSSLVWQGLWGRW